MEEYANAYFDVYMEYEPYYHQSAFGFPNLQIIKMDDWDNIHPATWGFVPEWAMQKIDVFRHKYTTYNAKQETIFTSSVYQESALKKRCLVIVDGFFEPHRENGVSIPYYCYQPNRSYKDGRGIFSFAGLYSEIDSDAFSVTILTTEANDFFSEIHNVKKRMPMVLDESLKMEWLNDILDEKNLKELLQFGFTKDEFKAHPVSRDLYKKTVDTNRPYIIEPIDKGTLF